jgi:hypothetical protein
MRLTREQCPNRFASGREGSIASEGSFAMEATRASTKIRVVIPALDEGRGITNVLPTLPDDVLKLVLVHRGSGDDTVAASPAHARRSAVVQRRYSGDAHAFIAGLAVYSGDAVVVLDAGLSTTAPRSASVVDAVLRGARREGRRFGTRCSA